uniref:BRCA1 associated ATM activator 1 n=1 Tax=Nothoprocta perdicaria TaxID=30464 RepID=A0A8C6YMQ8_NOTPE
MSRECGLLLPRVCAALAGPRPPAAADTCLQKLLDWLGELSEAEPGLKLLQDNPCLAELLAAVLALPEPGAGLLSFALRLAGLLAASESAFQHLQPWMSSSLCRETPACSWPQLPGGSWCTRSPSPLSMKCLKLPAPGSATGPRAPK